MNSRSSERNNWLSESSVLMRWIRREHQDSERQRGENRRRRSPEGNEREPLDAVTEALQKRLPDWRQERCFLAPSI
jgi:hypothetical protein